MVAAKIKPFAKPRPRAKQALAKARSFSRGTVDRATLIALAKPWRDADVREMERAMEDFEGDAFVVDGDLVVDGDFRTFDAGATWLTVRGNLIVKGLYEDICGSGPDFVWIEGDLRATDVLTAGRLVVQGNVTAQRCIIGDYNDGGCDIQGDVDALLFAMLDHPYRVKGVNRATYQLADERYKRIKKNETRWADIPFVEGVTPNGLDKRLRQRLPIIAAPKR